MTVHEAEWLHVASLEGFLHLSKCGRACSPVCQLLNKEMASIQGGSKGLRSQEKMSQ